jgi:hypothetical protein
MKKNILIIGLCTLAMSFHAIAGNKDRVGQATATELMVNPWAGSNGVFGMNGALVKGVEAMKVNSAGILGVDKFDLGASYNNYFGTSGISIVNAGATGKVNSRTSIGANVMSVRWGDIPVTTVDNPEGTGVTFSPSIFNATFSGAYEFTKHINAGMGVTYVSNALSNASSTALAVDAGIMYTTGDNDETHFGVSLRNVGSNMSFTGDGMAFNGTSPDDPNKSLTVLQRSAKFQLPTQLNISGAYDLYLGQRSATDIYSEDSSSKTSVKGKSNTRLTLMGSFISNSFGNDYLGVGAELGLKDRILFRAGYRYESGILDAVQSTFFRGLSAGVGLAVPMGDNQNKLVFDYAFRPSILGGVHSVGLRLTK